MPLKILIVEGCSEEILTAIEARGDGFGSHDYRDSLRLHAPDAVYHIAYPYAPDRNRDLLDLAAYDGIALTGSAVSWGAEMPEARPYLDFLEKVLATGKPVLGSCWGMQTVAVLLGGMSGPNPKGSEIGIARNIHLTEAGKAHPLFAGMPDIFNSPCWHRDHVTRMPEGAVLLASNSVSEVQAMAYNGNGIDYMGFQFHPEVPLDHFRANHGRNAKLPGTIRELVDFPDNPPHDIADAALRTRPLANWLNHVNSCASNSRQAAE
jgi:GMP synthase (glutamine-hydrolysing)